MSNLKRLREEKHYSQGQLAYISKVSLRSIKAYEQRYRNINKASGETLKRLAIALDCDIEEILEE